MGQGMARNLLGAGFAVTVWNRTASRMQPLVEAGARSGESPGDVAARSDITIVCVSDTPDVREGILGESGVMSGANEGSLVIGKVVEMSPAEWHERNTEPLLYFKGAYRHLRELEQLAG